MRRFVIAQPEDHRPIHVWEDGEGNAWACCAYDHGPFCRLCQRVDDVLGELLFHCAEGNMLARAQADGEFEFKITAKGKAAAENLIHGNVEMAALWAELQQRGFGPQ